MAYLLTCFAGAAIQHALDTRDTVLLLASSYLAIVAGAATLAA